VKISNRTPNGRIHGRIFPRHFVPGGRRSVIARPAVNRTHDRVRSRHTPGGVGLHHIVPPRQKITARRSSGKVRQNRNDERESKEHPARSHQHSAERARGRVCQECFELIHRGPTKSTRSCPRQKGHRIRRRMERINGQAGSCLRSRSAGENRANRLSSVWTARPFCGVVPKRRRSGTEHLKSSDDLLSYAV
jgi:hypothetical protein